MARDIPGTNGNYLSVGDASAIDITGTALTIACWIRPDTIGGFALVIAKDGGVDATRIQYRLSVDVSGTARITGAIGDSSNVDSATGATTVTTSVWHHAALVKNGTGAGALKIYLDGVQDASVTSNRSMQNRSEGLRFGNRETNDRPFDGRIAEVGVWNVALTGPEVASLALGYPPSSIQASNLKGYWQLVGTASPEPDTSGNDNDAAIVGTVNSANHVPVVTGYGLAGLAAAGASESILVEAGTGIVGGVGSGVKVFSAGTTYLKTGFGKVGLVGSGPKDHSHPASTYTKAGFAKIGTTVAIATSGFFADVVPRGISIAFGGSWLDPYPTWTRIDGG